MIEININGQYLMSINVNIKDVSFKRECEIRDIVYPYYFAFDKPEIRKELKDKVMKLFIDDRKEKLKKLNELKG